MNSILSKNKQCWICGATTNLQYHHIYFGKNRKISDENGFTVWLCYEHHKGQNGVHEKNGHLIDLILKEICQQEFERTHTRQEFFDLIGKNYL